MNSARLRFVKGHGTQNDFVLLPDPDGRLDLSADLVRALCDRRSGIGGDGVLRVVRTAALADPVPAGAEWFMDYRNADGSFAEMCGNGVRVLARYLVDSGLAAPGELAVATRGGIRTVRLAESGDVTVDMGAPAMPPGTPKVGRRAGTAVEMPNPHVVVALDTMEELAGQDLTTAPAVEPALPGGQNVEFVVRVEPRRLVMRVHERGSGETRSCGTGVCAAVVATVMSSGEGRAQPWQVDVPGGRLTVDWTAPGPVLLTGPAVLVAEGEFLLQG